MHTVTHTRGQHHTIYINGSRRMLSSVLMAPVVTAGPAEPIRFLEDSPNGNTVLERIEITLQRHQLCTSRVYRSGNPVRPIGAEPEHLRKQMPEQVHTHLTEQKRTRKHTQVRKPHRTQMPEQVPQEKRTQIFTSGSTPRAPLQEWCSEHTGGNRHDKEYREKPSQNHGARRTVPRISQPLPRSRRRSTLISRNTWTQPVRRRPRRTHRSVRNHQEDEQTRRHRGRPPPPQFSHGTNALRDHSLWARSRQTLRLRRTRRTRHQRATHEHARTLKSNRTDRRTVRITSSTIP